MMALGVGLGNAQFGNAPSDNWTPASYSAMMDLAGLDDSSWFIYAGVSPEYSTFTCTHFARRDGYLHSFILGQHYIQSCVDGVPGLLQPYNTGIWYDTQSQHVFNRGHARIDPPY